MNGADYDNEIKELCSFVFSINLIRLRSWLGRMQWRGGWHTKNGVKINEGNVAGRLLYGNGDI